MFVLLIPSSLIMAEETAQENSINIYLQLGKDEITINDETVTIVKPYVVNGTTLVPLRVITEAFGAELTWVSETRTVILEYGDKIIELSIGSKEAYVNEMMQELLVAPALVSSTTMVPLRFISENFGAKVEYVDLTREIFITGTLPGAVADHVNEDEVMTQIGDSHFGWTLDYPSGMRIIDQYFDGSWVVLRDINAEYEIYISVEDNDSLSLTDVLSEAEYAGNRWGDLLDSRIVITDDHSYARALSKDSDGVFNEMRGYLYNSKIYRFSLQVLNEADYLNEDKLTKYEDLVNSFVLTYDTDSLTTRDITKVKDGFIHYSDDYYGISLKVPEGWSEAGGGDDLSFSNEILQRGLILNFNTRLERDATIADWIKSIDDDPWMKSFYDGGWLKYGEDEHITVSGEPAIHRNISLKLETDWLTFYEVYFFIGDFIKVNVAVYCLSDDYDDMKPTIETIIESIAINEEQLMQYFKSFLSLSNYNNY